MVNVGLSMGTILKLGSTLFTPSLAQIVNVGFGPAGLLGITVAVAGAALYFLRTIRPELARDHDIFFAAVGLLCGGILFFQGWRLDPILLFGQLLLTGSSVFFAIESIRLRQVSTVQAKRSGGTPIFEEDEQPFTNRRGSRDFYAELDEYGSTYDDPGRPQIRGTRDNSDRRAYIDELPSDNRSRRSPGRSSQSSQRSSSTNRPSSKSRPDRTNPSGRSRRDSRPDSQGIYSTPEEDFAAWGDSDYSDPGAARGQSDVRETPVNFERGGSSRSSNKGKANSSKPRRKRPRPESPANPAPTGDYVDYQPIDYSDYKNYTDSEQDNSADFDDDDNKRS
ncbi:hypothetical protein AVDCRST_MAG81-1342 [uncultured Synechococcales cyanobacterium]|uniref:Uncharacterized protein n=1 Tax=uncultured Synechococcales cyanobacterium TaxID=1936017 RepID=A0A6J4V2J2_9CYAN|nr:hypothetical protein AVDCRST_MAG81-1342 [uncultured Synechococcales cyanobacterium]